MPKGIYNNRGQDNSLKMQNLRKFWREQYQLRKNDLKRKRIEKILTSEEEENLHFRQSILRYLAKYKKDKILYLNRTKRLDKVCKYFDILNIPYIIKNGK